MLSAQDLYDNVFGSMSPKDMSSGFGIDPNANRSFEFDPNKTSPTGIQPAPVNTNTGIQKAPSLQSGDTTPQPGGSGGGGDLTKMLNSQVNQFVPKTPGNFGGFSSYGDPSRYTNMWNTSKDDSSGYLQLLMKFMGG